MEMTRHLSVRVVSDFRTVVEANERLGYARYLSCCRGRFALWALPLSVLRSRLPPIRNAVRNSHDFDSYLRLAGPCQ